MNNLDIRINGDITESYVDELVSTIESKLSDKNIDQISVYLCSYGGSTVGAAKLSGFLSTLHVEKYLYCFGSVASCAIDILVTVAWDRVASHPLCSFMCHRPYYSIGFEHEMRPKNVRKVIDHVSKQNKFEMDLQVGAYRKSPNFSKRMSLKKVKSIFFPKKDTYYTPRFMKSLGLVDQIVVLGG